MHTLLQDLNHAVHRAGSAVELQQMVACTSVQYCPQACMQCAVCPICHEMVYCFCSFQQLLVLQSQFGFGLREAAHNLRICPTTLKRACRRHGIYRWPRRQSWGGGAGDVGSTESMNLDGDSVSSAGLAAGSDLSSLAAPTPAAGQLHTACN